MEISELVSLSAPCRVAPTHTFLVACSMQTSRHLRGRNLIGPGEVLREGRKELTLKQPQSTHA